MYCRINNQEEYENYSYEFLEKDVVIKTIPEEDNKTKATPCECLETFENCAEDNNNDIEININKYTTKKLVNIL